MSGNPKSFKSCNLTARAQMISEAENDVETQTQDVSSNRKKGSDYESSREGLSLLGCCSVYRLTSIVPLIVLVVLVMKALNIIYPPLSAFSEPFALKDRSHRVYENWAQGAGIESMLRVSRFDYTSVGGPKDVRGMGAATQISPGDIIASIPLSAMLTSHPNSFAFDTKLSELRTKLVELLDVRTSKNQGSCRKGLRFARRKTPYAILP